MTERLPFGDQLASLRIPSPGPQSQALARRLERVEAPGATYLSDDFPIFWERTLGANVEDVDGNVYVDLTAAFGVAGVGHTNRTVATAIGRQLEKLSHGMGDVHPPAIKVELMERLASLFPAPSARLLLAGSGADAIETALKTAFLATGKPGVIHFEGGYHGLSYGTLSVNGRPSFSNPFRTQLAAFGSMAPYPRANSEISMRPLEQILATAKQPIGAVLVEPIQGRAGIIVPPPGWLKALRKFTREEGLVLIVDEIMTGFGRTGKRFAIDHESVVPDLLCVGKALTGIFPFSACIGTDEVMRSWPASTGEALHTSTFLGHPLGCAAALAAIRELESRDLAKRAAQVGAAMLERMHDWPERFPLVREVRGVGLMIGVELARNGATGLAFELTKRALKEGLLLLPSGTDGNVLSITPPLTIAGKQVDWALATLESLF